MSSSKSDVKNSKVAEAGSTSPELWNCELKKIDEAQADAPWTVGAFKMLSCRGEFVERLDAGKTQIKFPDEKDKYLLKVIKAHSISETHADLIVTPYTPGQVVKKSFEVTDGINSFFVKDLSWEVKSVIVKKAAAVPGQVQQPPQPFGPTPPLELIWPLWIWGVIIVPALLLVFYLYRFLMKSISRNRLLDELAAHQTALSPYNEFNKDMRKIHREYHSVGYLKLAKETDASEYFQDLSKAYKMYLTRELKVHAVKWKISTLMSDIKQRNKKVFLKCSTEIKQILTEFENGENKAVSLDDCDQLSEMCKRSAAQIIKTGGFK